MERLAESSPSNGGYAIWDGGFALATLRAIRKFFFQEAPQRSHPSGSVQVARQYLFPLPHSEWDALERSDARVCPAHWGLAAVSTAASASVCERKYEMSACKALAARITNRIQQSTGSFLSLVLLGSVTAAPLLAQNHTMSNDDHAPAKLVQIVQDATRKYLNVNNATGAGYAPFLGCVPGQDFGAMGVHYVNGALLNGVLNEDQPQALIYEPKGNLLQLVGVEYILDATTWLKSHATPPVLE